MKLTAIIFPDSETDWLVAECTEIGTASQGHTEEEALANLQEATDLYLESFPQTLKKPAAIPVLTQEVLEQVRWEAKRDTALDFEQG